MPTGKGKGEKPGATGKGKEEKGQGEAQDSAETLCDTQVADIQIESTDDVEDDGSANTWGSDDDIEGKGKGKVKFQGDNNYGQAKGTVSEKGRAFLVPY